MQTSMRLVATALTLLWMVAPLGAAPVTISDPGSDFEITYDDEQTGLFGTPVLRNNTIFFLPSDFTAESLNGEGFDIANSTIQLMLRATTPGFTFDNFNLLERGDYILDGPGAEVFVDGTMRVFDIDDPFDETFVFIEEDAPLNINDGDLHNWTASAAIDTSTGWAAGATEVVLTLENILRAFTDQPATLAFIEKKFEGVRIQVNPVPVPAALWLFAPAVLALLRRRRRG